MGVSDSENSKLREVIAEHLFIGEALRHCWVRGVTDVEVLRSESDYFGYDVVLARGQIVRHIQLKTRRSDGKRREVNVGLKLMDKPSGCVIWIMLTSDLRMDHFFWYGGSPGEPLENISEGKTLKHSKGDASGTKAERPAHREVSIAKFTRLQSIEDVLERLFGSLGIEAKSEIT
jgi:hypothetical protein